MRIGTKIRILLLLSLLTLAVPKTYGVGEALYKFMRANAPLNGYAVYDNDTIRGAITCESHDTLFYGTTTYKFKYPKRIFVAEVVIQTGTQTWRCSEQDPRLKFLFMQDRSGNKISLVRFITNFPFVGRQNRLYRQVHFGKVSFYDNQISFTYEKALRPFIENDDIVIQKAGAEPEFLYRPRTNCKKRIIEAINDAYGMHLKPADYKPDELYDLVSRLD